MPENTTTTPEIPPMAVKRPNWKQLTESYVQCTVSIKFWQGKSKLGLADLGYDTESEFATMAQEYLRLGQQYLIPPRYIGTLTSLKNRVRQCAVRHNGIASPWKTGAFLILRTSYLEWRTEMQSLEVEFLAAKALISSERSQWVEEAVAAHTHRCRQALLTQSQAMFEGAALVASGDETELNDIVDEFRASIPDDDEIDEKFSWNWYPEAIATPEALSRGLSLEEIAERQLAAEHAVLAAEERLRAVEGQEGEERERQRLSVEDQRVRLETERRIWRDAQERAAQARVQELDRVCGDVAAQIRELVATTAQGILDGAGKRDQLHGSSVNALQEMLRRIRVLNIADDPEVERVIESVQALGAGTEHAVSAEEMQRSMQEVSQWARAGLYALGRTDRFSSAEERRRGTFAPLEPQEIAPALQRFRQPRRVAEASVPTPAEAPEVSDESLELIGEVLTAQSGVPLVASRNGRQKRGAALEIPVPLNDVPEGGLPPVATGTPEPRRRRRQNP